MDRHMDQMEGRWEADGPRDRLIDRQMGARWVMGQTDGQIDGQRGGRMDQRDRQNGQLIGRYRDLQKDRW